MTRTLIATLLCCAACATTGGPSFASYPLDELRALGAQAAWDELLQHAKDVAPSKRDEEWKRLVEQAAVGTLAAEAPESARDAEAALARAEQLLKAHPALKAAPAFLAARAELAVKAYAHTYANSRHSSSDDPWLQDVRRFVEKDAVTPGLAQRFAKDLVLQRLTASVAFPFYRLALARDGAKVCAEPELATVLLATIEDGSWAAEVKDAATTCWAQVKDPLVAGLKKGEPRGLVRHGCKLIADKPEAAEVKATCAE